MENSLSLMDIQKIESDILSHIHDFCSENGLKYFLACGTLLGAIRHQGFIPWDDDVDIYMPREDYDRFIKEYPVKPHAHYILLSVYNDPNYYYDSARVVDSRTTITLKDVIENPSEGLWVDIFPLDNIPSFWILKRWLAFFLYSCRVLSVYTKFPSYKHSLVFYPLWVICKAIGPRFFLRTIEKIIICNKPSESVGYICSDVGPRSWFKREWCDNPVKILFEGKEYFAFSHYEEYLKSVYGDYMKLPPVEKRVSHPIQAYWR